MLPQRTPNPRKARFPSFRRKPEFLLILAVLLTIVITIACANGAASPTPADTVAPPTLSESHRVVTVTHVVDGDTVDVCCPEARVRLLGIDSPERDEPYFDEAADLMERLVDGQEARLEKCVEEADRYDRLLRHVFVDETHVNREMVAAGLATAYEFSLNLNPCYVSELRTDQAEAQSASLGIWAQ